MVAYLIICFKLLSDIGLFVLRHLCFPVLFLGRPLQLSLLKPENPPPAPERTEKLEKSGVKGSKEDPKVGEGQEEENAVKPKIIAKLAAQKISPSSGIKSRGKQAFGTKASKGKGSAKSNGSSRKRGSKVGESSLTARKGNRQDQATKVGRGGSGSSTARPQTSRDKQGKLVWTLTVVKGKGKASKSKEAGEVTADKTEPDQSEPQMSVREEDLSKTKQAKLLWTLTLVKGKGKHRPLNL